MGLPSTTILLADSVRIAGKTAPPVAFGSPLYRALGAQGEALDAYATLLGVEAQDAAETAAG